MRTFLMLFTFVFSTNIYAANCGALNQRPCTIFQRIPSCDNGLVENFALGKCVSRATSKPAPVPAPAPPTPSRPAPPPPAPTASTNCGGYNQSGCQGNGSANICSDGLNYYYQMGKCLNADRTKEYATWIKFANGDVLGIAGRSNNAADVRLPAYFVQNQYELQTYSVNVQPGQCLGTFTVQNSSNAQYVNRTLNELRVNWFNFKLEQAGAGTAWIAVSQIAAASPDFQRAPRCVNQPAPAGPVQAQRIPQAKFGCEANDQWKWVGESGDTVEPIACDSLLKSRWLIKGLVQPFTATGETFTPTGSSQTRLDLGDARSVASPLEVTGNRLSIQNIRCTTPRCSGLQFSYPNGAQYTHYGYWQKIQ